MSRTPRTPQLLPTNPSFENPGLQHIILGDGRILSFDPTSMDEPTRTFVEQHRRAQQQLPPPLGSANSKGKAAAQRALGVNAQLGQSQVQQPPAQRVMVAPNGQYYLDAQGRPVQVSAWPQVQQRGMANGQFTPQAQQFTGQQQQMLQHQYAQQYYMQQQQQQQLAQQRGSLPPSVRPPQSATKSPALLQVPPPPNKRAVSRAASRSASPIPPYLRPPSASISQPMQPTTSAMPISGSNPTLLPVRASTLPVPSSVHHTFPPSNTTPVADTAAGPSRSALATARTQPNFGSGIRMDKPYHLEARLSAVARVRKREDMTSRLKRHIEQAEAQLEVVIKEEKEEAAKMTGGKREVEDEDRQEKFHNLILEYLRHAGFADTAAMLRRDMVRSHNSSSTTQSVKTSPDASSDIAVRSPRAESSAGDATLIKNTTGDVSIEKTSPRVSPIKGASPMKKAVNGDSPAGNQSSPRMLNERISSPDSMFEEDGHAKGLSHCTEAQSMPIDEGGRQAQTVGGSPMEVNIKGSGSEDPSKISVVRASPCRAKRIPESSDFGYLYSWWTVFEDTQCLVKQKLLHSRSRSPWQAPAIPNTAMQPTSAMATRIAVSAPAAAVRASSADFTAQRIDRPLKHPSFSQISQINTSGPPNGIGVEPPLTAVTAQLQAADAMRRSQQAQIDAQQEDYKRRHQSGQNGVMAQNGPTFSSVPRQQVILGNRTQTQMTPEEVQRQIMAQYTYQQQQQLAQQAQLAAQANDQFRPDATNAGARQYHPVPLRALMQHGPDSGGSPSTDSGRSVKRPVETSPTEASSKKARVAGKGPTPEEHQRQAIEVANRVAQQKPVQPGISQMPGQLHHMAGTPSQDMPSQLSDAERQYAQSQVTYARLQVQNSPAAQIAMSPAQTGESSPMNTTQSPSAYQSGFNVVVNGTPGPSKTNKSKQALSLVVDIDNVVEGPDVIPNSAVSVAPTKKKPAKKAPMKNVAGPGKGKGGKGGKGRPSSGETPPAATPPAATPGHSVTATPIFPSNEMFGGSGSVPGTSQSFAFQYPASGMELHAQERYDQEQLPHQQNPPHQYPTVFSHDQPQPSRQVNMQRGQQNNAQQHQEQVSGPDTRSTEDFLNSLQNFGNEVGVAPHPPVSAFQGTFDETAFDFDWATANFGGDENQDWAHLDPAVLEGVE